MIFLNMYQIILKRKHLDKCATEGNPINICEFQYGISAIMSLVAN